MSDSYILHDVMRKVKADGLFDSIRRDLISDIEQKSLYLDLKSQIESLMSSYLSDHKWSSSLKKSDIRERARQHIETSNLIKDTLPSLVNQYMQTCQQQLVQPRLSSFVSDHLDHIYNSIGGTHIYRPPTSYTQSISVQQEKPTQSTIPIKKEPVPSKPPTSTIIKQKTIPKKKPVPVQINSIKEEKKPRLLSPLHSPTELVDISPSPPSIENERRTTSLSPSPPPPIVRIASPLRTPSNTDLPRKIKRSEEKHDEKKKKIKTEDKQYEKSEAARRLRSRRPNPKYLNEQFETDDLNILEPPSSSSPPPVISKPKKHRQLKPSTSFDTPSSPPPPTFPPIETSVSVNDMSPEYGTSLPSPTIEKQQIENIDEQSRTPSPVMVKRKKATSPRRLRPRKAHERSSTTENQTDRTIDFPTRTSSKTREISRHRTEQTNVPSTNEDADLQQTIMTKTRHPSSPDADNSSNELPIRSMSVPDNLNATTDDTQPTRVSPIPVTAPVSKSFIWKPKISK